MKLIQNTQDRIERLIQSDDNKNVLQQPRFWARSITWSLMGITLFGLGWLSFAKTEQIVTARGKLEPLGTVRDVQMPVGGVVSQVLVKEGQQVKEGQVLLRLDTEATKDRQKTLQDTIRFKQSQLDLKEAELRRYLDLNSTEQAVLRKSLQLEQDILNRFKKLSESGASAELQYLQQRNKVQEIRGRLQQTSVDRLRQQAILEQNVKQLRGELADLQSKLIELNVNIRYQEIKSPTSGVVFELKANNAGFVAQTSEPVLKVVPYDKLEARVEIPNRDIGFVSIGKPVDISIDSFPASDFGVLVGKVRRIGSDALPPTETRQDYVFPADIKLDSQQLKLKDGTKLPLQVGMSLTANIKLRQVTYLQLLLSQFREKSESLQRL